MERERRLVSLSILETFIAWWGEGQGRRQWYDNEREQGSGAKSSALEIFIAWSDIVDKWGGWWKGVSRPEIVRAWWDSKYCSTQWGESKVTVFLLNQICGKCFLNQGNLRMIRYWPSLVGNKSRVFIWTLLNSSFKDNWVVTKWVIRSEFTILPSITVRVLGYNNKWIWNHTIA